MIRTTLAGRTVALAAAAILLLSGCTASPEPEAPVSSSSDDAVETDATSPFDDGSFYSATATMPLVRVLDAPDGEIASRLDHPNTAGAPLTFLIKEHEGDWLEVYLPTRPNGVTGWISARGMDIEELPYRLDVSTDDNELDLYEADELVATYSVATGTGGTPTPHGTFYLTELLAPTNDGYGPFAYGLSAFSEVLSEFGGGPGQIGLHGTNDTASIGQAVSHGCIRLANDDITELAEMLPLGTPIEIGA
ncbi:L,D-transpeptidase [Marisediminicola sp. LYQ85]|uniref:L,D-transpeptidase n=1 Tax=Marisediminicola sp. LYQ85 TaxID=3391062 RepID=UPI003983320F